MESSYPGNITRDYVLDTTGLSEVKFGRDIKEKEFFLRPEISFLNAGSYGAVPRRVLDLQTKYNLEREEYPDMWFRVNCKKYLDRARAKCAQFINAKVENVQLVPNATTAINTVIRSYPFKSGDAILDSDHTYGAINNLCMDFTSRIRPDVERVKLTIGLPVNSEDEIVGKYEEALVKHPNIKVVMLDHITSPTSIVMPVKRICQVCHAHGAVAFVDGAHGVGHLKVDMEDMGCDVYTSNLHKWGYSARGSAILWYADQHASWIHPPNTSWQIGRELEFQFFDQGTRDHVPLITALHGLEFYEALGGLEKIVGYTKTLADLAFKRVTEEVGLEPLPFPAQMQAPNLRIFTFPALKSFPEVSRGAVWTILKAVFGETNVFCHMDAVNGAFTLRFSIQIYNDEEDVDALVKALKGFIQKET